MTEKFSERTAGIWVPFAFYAAGGVYMLAFWAMFDRAAYHLLALGVVSVVIAGALYSLSRWAYWLGLFTFPLLFTNFVYAIVSSVNLVGWYPDIPNTLFHASMLVYLIFLTFSLILLVDKRNTLKSDRLLDTLAKPLSGLRTQEPTKESATT